MHYYVDLQKGTRIEELKYKRSLVSWRWIKTTDKHFLNYKLMVQLFNFLKIRFFLKIIYLREWASEREHTPVGGAAEAEGEAASSPWAGALRRCGLGSQDPGIMAWEEGRHLMDRAIQAPLKISFSVTFQIYLFLSQKMVKFIFVSCSYLCLCLIIGKEYYNK